jgi:hypothetical protein
MSHRSETYVVSRGFRDHLERTRPGLGQFFPVGSTVVLDVFPGDSRFALHLPAETAGCRQICDYRSSFDRMCESGFDVKVDTGEPVVVLDEHPLAHDLVKAHEAVRKLWPGRDASGLYFVAGQTVEAGDGEQFEVVDRAAFYVTLRSKKDGRTVKYDVDFGFSPKAPPAEGMQVGTEPYQLGASHVAIEPAGEHGCRGIGATIANTAALSKVDFS